MATRALRIDVDGTHDVIDLGDTPQLHRNKIVEATGGRWIERVVVTDGHPRDPERRLAFWVDEEGMLGATDRQVNYLGMAVLQNGLGLTLGQKLYGPLVFTEEQGSKVVDLYKSTIESLSDIANRIASANLDFFAKRNAERRYKAVAGSAAINIVDATDPEDWVSIYTIKRGDEVNDTLAEGGWILESDWSTNPETGDFVADIRKA